MDNFSPLGFSAIISLIIKVTNLEALYKSEFKLIIKSIDIKSFVYIECAYFDNTTKFKTVFEAFIILDLELDNKY